MSEPLRITIATHEPGFADQFKAIVAREPDVVVAVETRELEALAWAAGATPHVIVAVDRAGTGDPLDALARLRGLPRFANARIVLARPPLAPTDGVAELNHGVHEFVTVPLVPAEVIARVRTLADQRRLHDKVSEERARMDDMHSAFHAGLDQIIRLLIRLVDLHFPGADARGASVAALATRIAARFRIPERYTRDLDLAARLHEVGRMVLADADDEDEEADRRPALNPGAAALASRALLQDVDGFKGVAEILSSVYENWDGTGVPERLLQGQIPLRSRIVRVSIDYLHALDEHPGSAQVLERMEEHANTRYDPLVLAHLRAAVSEEGETPTLAAAHHITIEKLRVGMVLAEDLYTDNGLKLLTRGTALTPTSLDTIRRRHNMEPILRGAVVEREAA